MKLNYTTIGVTRKPVNDTSDDFSIKCVETTVRCYWKIFLD